jgi:dipeptidyl aminopeptidase/acylaminoacyl peptidase
MAVLLEGGILAQVPMEGGTPREILEGVDGADWTRDGKGFAVVRSLEDRQRLEYPIGNLLFETTGLQRIAEPRVSPAGELVAFVDRPAGLTDPAGDIAAVDRSGRKRVLSKAWAATSGLAWSRDGREVWFSGTKAGFAQALYAVTLSGQERVVARAPGGLNLKDIAPDGRVLMAEEQLRWETRGRMAGDPTERDLSWLDGTLLPWLSPDGSRMVFVEWGHGGGVGSSAFFRKMDGSAAVRLADGAPYAVSPDWTWVLCGTSPPTQELRLVPIGPGQARTLPRGTVRAYRAASWHPDGKRIVFQGSEAERPARIFVQDLATGLPRPVGPEGVNPTDWIALAISPDGRSYTARPPGARAPYALYPIDGGEPHSIPGLEIDDEPFVWSEDGRSLFVQIGTGRNPTRVEKLDVHTGRRQPWLELSPPDRAGVLYLGSAMVSPNGRHYTYFYPRDLSDLYLVEGLR